MCSTRPTCEHKPGAAYLRQRGAAEQVVAHVQTVLDDDTPPFQHAFAGHDVEESLEALLKRHEFLHLQVARCQLSQATNDRVGDRSRSKTRAVGSKPPATAKSSRGEEITTIQHPIVNSDPETLHTLSTYTSECCDTRHVKHACVRWLSYCRSAHPTNLRLKKKQPQPLTCPKNKMTSFLTSSLGSLKTSTKACRPAGHSKMRASSESAEDFCSACST